MKSALLSILFLALSAQAQTPVNPAASLPAKAVDAKLHEDTIKLVELSGTRQRLLDIIDASLESGRAAMAKQCPKCTPAFGNEWVKRMKQRYPTDQFVAVYVDVYERYLTDPEILELTALQNANGSGQPVDLSPALKTKLNSVMPSLLADIAGQCTRIGAKLGGEIGIEIQTEHPEYLGLAPTAGSALHP